MSFSAKQLERLSQARNYDQYASIRLEMLAGGTEKCPFCDPGRQGRYHRKGDFRTLGDNDFPYKHCQYHLIMFTIEHITDFLALTPAHFAEWGELNQWAIREFNLPGGGLVMRYGDSAYNSCTEDHIHSHDQVPDLTGEVKATFAKSPEKLAKDRARAEEFEREFLERHPEVA